MHNSIPPQNFKHIILLGASTGGTQAIKVVLQQLKATTPPILYVQHILPSFTKSLARTLNESCAVTVQEAVDGEYLQSGMVYLSPGDKHLELQHHAGGWQTKVYAGPRVNLHIPSVEPLFLSGTKFNNVSLVGVMLTGMGKDGAAAMVKLKKHGATTLAQSEASCVQHESGIFGMPRAAILMGAVDQVLSLEEIGKYLAQLT